MPQFAPSAQKTALAPITVMPSGLSCQAELYLVSGGTKVVTSGLRSFTSTGAAQNITFTITMPGTSGTYKVYLDIFVSGILIAAYLATEDVVIAIAVGLLTIVDLSFIYYHSGYSGSTPYDDYTVQVQVRNDGTAASSHIISYEDWRTGHPAVPGGAYSYPVISELNRISLSSGQAQTITLQNEYGLYKVNNLLMYIQGENTGTRVRALLDGDINSFSSEMFRTLY